MMVGHSILMKEAFQPATFWQQNDSVDFCFAGIETQGGFRAFCYGVQHILDFLELN